MMSGNERALSLASLCLVCLAVSCIAAHGAEPWYSNDFEQDSGFTFRGTNGECKVNVIGLSEEQALSGKRSLKIDVLCESGSWCYFHVPVSVKIEAGTKYYLSGYLHPEQLPADVRCGIGWSVIATGDKKPLQGNSPIGSISAIPRYWQQMQAEISGPLKKCADDLMTNYGGGTLQSMRLDHLYVHLSGPLAGKRIVLFLDDLRLTPELPGDLVSELDAYGDGKLRPVIDNGKFRLILDTQHGARGREWIDLTSGSDLVHWAPPIGGFAEEVFDHDRYPTANATSPHSYFIERGEDEARVRVWYGFPGGENAGLVTERDFVVKPGVPTLTVHWRIRNLSDRSRMFRTRIHNCLRPGGKMDESMAMQTPRAAGVLRTPFTLPATARELSVSDFSAGWQAVLDQERNGIVMTWEPAKILKAFYWLQDADNASQEWFYRPDFVRPGEAWETEFSYHLVHSQQEFARAIATARLFARQRTDAPTRDVEAEFRAARGEERRAALAVMIEALGPAAKGRRYLLYARSIFEPVVYETVPRTENLVSRLEILAAPDQYEPASFCVFALSELPSVKVSVSALEPEGEGRSISREQIDLRVVRCWDRRVSRKSVDTVPELLMYDDTLKLAGVMAAGGKVSDPWRETLDVAIPELTSKQFWLTVHAPTDATPGAYEGTITISAQDAPTRTLGLRLTVLPIELRKPPDKLWGTCFPLNWRNVMPENYRLYCRDHAQHGFDFCRVQHSGMTNVDELMSIYREEGLGGPWIDLGVAINADAIRKLVETARAHGFGEVWVFTIDEPHTEEGLARTKRLLEIVKQVPGAKTYVPGYITLKKLEPYLDERDMGIGYSISEEMEQEARRVPCGFYNNDVAEGEKSPEARIVSGLWFYKTPFARFCPWAYLAPMGENSDPYDDFEGGRGWWRDCCLVRPTVEGPMLTQHWEAMRAGVDDVRYLYTLQQMIARAERQKGAARAPLVEEMRQAKTLVEGILSKIDERNAARTRQKLGPRELQELRHQVAHQIVRLQEAISP